jgi:hypothetical protein
MLPWLVLCLVLTPSAAFLLWSWRISRDDMSLMRATETTPAADIATLPPGSLVEVKGRLRCAAPLTADLSKSPCAHFVASVERDYEKLEYDASRKASYRVRRTACVHTNTMSASFEIEDDGGRATRARSSRGSKRSTATRWSATLRNGSAACRPRPATT